jgi:AcrR family transcriptional regulator
MAPHTPADKRTRIVDHAAQLVHEHGFASTSLADIARESGVPLGNLYYYFKTKEAIGEALIEKMAALHDELRQGWDRDLQPRERIEAFIQTAVESRESLARSGCPIGSLCTELHKTGGPLADRATALFDGFLRWLEAQFRQIGQGSESRELAIHLIASLQGAILLAHGFHNPRLLAREAQRQKEWVRSL